MQKRTPLRRYIYLTNKLFPRLVTATEKVVCFVERGIYGWSRYDCYAGDVYLVHLMIDMIHWIKENKWGVPHDFVIKAMEQRLVSIENGDDPVDYAVDLYNGTLDEIIFGLEEYLKVMDYDYKIEGDKDWMEIQELVGVANRKFRKSMILLAKYFHTLGV